MAQTNHIFSRNQLRNQLHSVILVAGMVGLCSALGWFMWGGWGVIWIGALGLVYALMGPRLTPHLILKMYQARKLSEHEAPQLKRMIRGLSERAGLAHEPDLYYVPSMISNAFTVGTRGRAAIGVTDGMLRSMSPREMLAILAHEVSHVASNDGWVMNLADTVSQLVNTFSIVGQILLLINLPLLATGYYAVPWLVILLMIFAPTLSALLQLALSRTREYDADLDSIKLTGDPGGLILALAKLERLQGGWLERLFLPGRRVPDPSLLRTHPRTEDRIERLRELEAELTGKPVDHDRYRPHDLRDVPARDLHPPRWRFNGFWY